MLKQLFSRLSAGTAPLRDLQQHRQQADSIYERSLEQVRRLEAEIRQKRRDHKNCSSANQQAIINSQINGLLDELQMINERTRMIDRYVADITAAIHTAETIIAARDQNLDGMAIDCLAVELEDAIEKMRDTDTAMGELRAQLYEPPTKRPVTALTLEVVQQSRQAAAQDDLPEATRQRLESLGVDEE
jgi:CRISPR/Cas system CSM-associated protein Csm2 small subunit